jgi:hypothetical protein
MRPPQGYQENWNPTWDLQIVYLKKRKTQALKNKNPL